MTDVPHDREVMADEKVGKAILFLQVDQQVQHLRLHRHVERRDRLVGHDHVGIDRQGLGDAQPLALAAGEFMRELAHRLGAKADALEELRYPLVAVRTLCDAEIFQRLADDGSRRQARVHRGVRILEDRLDAPAMRPHRTGIERGDVFARQHDLAGRRFDQLQHDLADRRLAAARLAHKAQRLAAADREGDAIDRPHLADAALQQAAVDREMFHESFDLQDGCVAHAAFLTLSISQQATRWPAPASTSGGASRRHRSVAKPQRGAKAQPTIGWVRIGTRPGIS